MSGSHADGEQLARVSRRAAALLIDFLVWVIVVVFIVNISGVYIGWSPTGYMAAVAPGITLGFIVLGFIYFIVCERIWGRTIGKLCAGIEVRSQDGGRIGWGASVIRNLMRIVDGFPYLIPYAVGCIAAFNSVGNKRLGDMWADSEVVSAAPELSYYA